ncbi:hypothetical protein SAMN04488042_106141 [Shimia aestuarii]|uniref:Uncharacterized protein n=1 Tax=Shimia aestuarii TaxID=254406 RepID=A0A1I4Q2C3_9RHOB|nr:hypothetical protein SAMN04488042_106141 [Shimia aestuarii]
MHTNNGMLSPVDFELRQQKLNQAGFREATGTSIPVYCPHRSVGMLVNPVPLSDTIVPGIQCSAIARFSSRVTRSLDRNVSAVRPRFSR